MAKIFGGHFNAHSPDCLTLSLIPSRSSEWASENRLASADNVAA